MEYIKNAHLKFVRLGLSENGAKCMRAEGFTGKLLGHSVSEMGFLGAR